MKKENFEKRRKLLKKEEIINKFFNVMATKKDLSLYAILIIIIDYVITILRFKQIYKKIINTIIILLLFINLSIELLIGFNNIIIFLLIILMIVIRYVSCLEIKFFEKAKKA